MQKCDIRVPGHGMAMPSGLEQFFARHSVCMLGAVSAVRGTCSGGGVGRIWFRCACGGAPPEHPSDMRLSGSSCGAASLIATTTLSSRCWGLQMWRLTQCLVHSTASLACLELLQVARAMERGPQHLRLSEAEHGNISRRRRTWKKHQLSLKFSLVTIQPRCKISPVIGRSLRAQREQPASVVTIQAITILCCAAQIRGKRAALPRRRNQSMEVHDEH